MKLNVLNYDEAAQVACELFDACKSKRVMFSANCDKWASKCVCNNAAEVMDAIIDAQEYCADAVITVTPW